MERQEGYYWVKFMGDFQIADWSINCEGVWSICGCDINRIDSEFEFINENRIKYPGELPD